MYDDRRLYSRLSIVNVPVMIYVDNVDIEFNGYVHDISEVGIGITIDNIDITQINIEPNTRLKLVFLDEVYYVDQHDTCVIMCECIVKHIDTINNIIFLGGTVENEDYRKYYLKKEMAVFVRDYI